MDETTGLRASRLLQNASRVMQERDQAYRGSDQLYAEVMAALFPDGVTLKTEADHHRFHIFMLAMVKVTRYARNWEAGHDDSLTDLINYAAMLQAIDRAGAVPPVL